MSSTRDEARVGAFKNLNNYLANERTHLSEVRTALSFVSFGITLNRFSLYLIQSSEKGHPAGTKFLNDGASTGIGMVLLGLFMMIYSVFRYRKVLNAIAEEKYTPPTMTNAIVSSVLIVLAVLGVVWVIFE